MITPGKSLLVFVVVFLVFAAQLNADELPDYDAINQLSKKAEQVAGDFLVQTFEIRMRYEYTGDFFDPNDKATLCELADKASADLERIANDQNNLKKQIEDYHGDDWEARFGRTGLWRQLAADLLKTTLSRFEIQYYLALGLDPPGRTDVLRQIIVRLDAIENPGRLGHWRLLNAKTIALLSLTEPGCQPLAVNQFNALVAQKDIPCQVRFRAELEIIKLLGPQMTGQLGEIADRIARTDCKSDREITLKLACLEHRFEPQSLEKTLSLFSLIQDKFGLVVLDDLQQRYNGDGFVDANSLPITAYEVEQAASVVSGVGLEKYAALLERLVSSPKFRTPALLFIAGQSVIDSSPAKTTRLWIDASRLMHEKPYGMLNLTADTVAKFAIGASEKLYTENTTDCSLIIEAFDNYLSIAKSGSEPDYNYIEYYYAAVALNSCGKKSQSQKLLEKITSTPGQYQNHAKFELITQKLEQAHTDAEKHILAAQLADLISNIPPKGSENRDLRYEATAIYCRIHLDEARAQSAQRVLDILDANEPMADMQYDFFRARALHLLGRLEDSAHFMAGAVDNNDCSAAPYAASLVSDALDKIELWQQNARDFNQMLLDCELLAGFADKCLNSRQTNLLAAETTILQGKKYAQPFPANSENDLSWLRVIARNLMAEGEFNKAARIWVKIAELRRNETVGSNAKSYGWWQAKFYELECLSKIPNPDKTAIIHTIEVLQNTYPDVPAPWAEKFSRLKTETQ